MFSVVKVRKDLKPGDYRDPGWFQHPPGTVAREWTGAVAAPAGQAQGGGSSMAPAAKPTRDVEVQVRRPSGGHSGH
jgi:hypothetical protein